MRQVRLCASPAHIQDRSHQLRNKIKTNDKNSHFRD